MNSTLTSEVHISQMLPAGRVMTISGPNLRLNVLTTIALTGTRMKAELAGSPVPYGQVVAVAAGSVFKLKSVQDGGGRTYLALQGGLDAADYMGSKAPSRWVSSAAMPGAACGRAVCSGWIS